MGACRPCNLYKSIGSRLKMVNLNETHREKKHTIHKEDKDENDLKPTI